MKNKEGLHRLVDGLPETEVDAAGRYLEYLRNLTDPFVRALLEAPEDNEVTLPGEDQAADEAWQEHLRSRT